MLFFNDKTFQLSDFEDNKLRGIDQCKNCYKEQLCIHKNNNSNLISSVLIQNNKFNSIDPKFILNGVTYEIEIGSGVEIYKENNAFFVKIINFEL